jgi:DNA modification methylase
MAPELALDRLPTKAGAHVLDPMMGSGTLPVLAGLNGHRATGFDLDPLAVLIARASARPLRKDRFLRAAEDVAARARRGARHRPSFRDAETAAFVERWFDPIAQRRLGALARAIRREHEPLQPALWVAFSRLIITKDVGASLARDVSHSRPHKVREITHFNPLDHFERSAREVQRRHELLSQTRPKKSALRTQLGDARALPLGDNTVDVVMTSPPYLVAIDYLRGHRLSLVWMGHTIPALREIRGTAVGSERGSARAGAHEDLLAKTLNSDAPPRAWNVLRRYVSDISRVLDEIERVLRPTGSATFVVADATLCGVAVSVSGIVDELARARGFRGTECVERELPADRRYLPPPQEDGGYLARRMKREVCLGYRLARQ